MPEWVKFYPQRWRQSERVQTMTLEERGLYMTLLMLQPISGSLPADMRLLSRLAGVDLRQMKRLAPRVLCHFEEVGIAGEIRLRNPVMHQVSEDANASYSKGARARWDKRSNRATPPLADTAEGAVVVDATHLHTHAHTRSVSVSLSESDSDSKIICASGSGPEADVKALPSSGEPPEFTEFYEQLYPRPVGRGAAMEAWHRNVTTDEQRQTLLEATRRARKGIWRERPQDKIPHPANWINGTDWRDPHADLDARTWKPKPPRPASPEAAYPDYTDGVYH